MELEHSSDEENEPHDPDIPAVRLEASQFQQLLSPFRDVYETQDEDLLMTSTGKNAKATEEEEYFSG